jgi:DnaJ-domain-containing protein 1
MDHFARFGLLPRPWIDPDLLREKFLALSAEKHPDKAVAEEKLAAENEFKEINQSYQVLNNTRLRLLHLLEISGIPKQEHAQNVPAAALEFFPLVAEAAKRADGLLKEKGAANSPMLKVQFVEKSLVETEQIQQVQARIGQRIKVMEERLKEIDQQWPSRPAATDLAILEDCAGALGFLDRWRSQLQERLFALAF